MEWLTAGILVLILGALAYWLGYQHGHRNGYHTGMADGVWQAVRQLHAQHRPRPPGS